MNGHNATTAQRTALDAERGAALGPKGPPVRAIVAAVGRHYGVEPRQILGRRRFVRVSMARHAAIWLALTLRPELGWTDVGRLLDLDHKSVIYGYRKMKGLVERDPALAGRLRALSEQAAR